MSLADTTVKTTHANVGGGTTFAIPFAATQEDSDRIKVYLRDETDPDAPVITLQVEGPGDDYTVDQSASNVIFNATVTAGIKVVIIRELELIQPLDLQAAGALRPEVLEEQLDDIVRMVQQLNEKLSRVPILNVTEQLTESGLELPQPVGDNLIGWNNDGTAIRNFTRTEFDLVTGDLASTDDLPEGSTNKYYTDGRADARADIRIAALVEPNAMTTLGDLTRGGASGVYTRLGIGSERQRLAVSSGLPAWVSGSPYQVQRSVTGTDTCTTADEVLNLSGASFTENLFTAVGNDGKRLTLKHLGTSLTQEYTIDPNGAQTVGGKASIKMTTYGEVFVLEANNGNWDIVYHKCDTDWVSAGAVTIDATTTAPTKPSGILVDRLVWRRDGKDLLGRIEYEQTDTTSAASGSGDYLFTAVPSGVTIDTTFATTYTTVIGDNAWSLGQNVGQFGGKLTSTQSHLGMVNIYDTTRVRFMSIRVSSAASVQIGVIGGITGHLAAYTNLSYFADFRVPITGWEA